MRWTMNKKNKNNSISCISWLLFFHFFTNYFFSIFTGFFTPRERTKASRQDRRSEVRNVCFPPQQAESQVPLMIIINIYIYILTSSLFVFFSLLSTSSLHPPLESWSETKVPMLHSKGTTAWTVSIDAVVGDVLPPAEKSWRISEKKKTIIAHIFGNSSHHEIKYDDLLSVSPMFVAAFVRTSSRNVVNPCKLMKAVHQSLTTSRKPNKKSWLGIVCSWVYPIHSLLGRI